jgi:hypothetical protein
MPEHRLMAEVRRLEERIRELERQLGRKTLEVEILKEAIAKSRAKNDLAGRIAAGGRFPVKTIADTLGVARSSLVRQLTRRAIPRAHYAKAGNASAASPCAAAGRSTIDLRLSPHHRTAEPRAGCGRLAAGQSQARLPG